MEAGQGALYLNGLDVGSIESLDMFALSSLLKKASKLFEAFAHLGLTTHQIRDLFYFADDSKSSGSGGNANGGGGNDNSNSDYGIDIDILF